MGGDGVHTNTRSLFRGNTRTRKQSKQLFKKMTEHNGSVKLLQNNNSVVVIIFMNFKT